MEFVEVSVVTLDLINLKIAFNLEARHGFAFVLFWGVNLFAQHNKKTPNPEFRPAPKQHTHNKPTVEQCVAVGDVSHSNDCKFGGHLDMCIVSSVRW